MKYWMDATSYGTLRKFCNNEFEKNQAVLYALYDFLIFHTIYFLRKLFIFFNIINNNFTLFR